MKHTDMVWFFIACREDALKRVFLSIGMAHFTRRRFGRRIARFPKRILIGIRA
jgi:hypothetical protein